MEEGIKKGMISTRTGLVVEVQKEHKKTQYRTFLSVLVAACLVFSTSCNTKSDNASEPQATVSTHDGMQALSQAIVQNTHTDSIPADTKPEHVELDGIDVKSIESLPAPTELQPPADTPVDNAQNPTEPANAQAQCDCPCRQDDASQPSDDSDDRDEDSDDDAEECDHEPTNDCAMSFVEYEGYVDRLMEFGRRHEIQGDLSGVKWAELEPKLPDSVIKFENDKNVIHALESKYPYRCAFAQDEKGKTLAPKTATDGTVVQIIFCSKIDRRSSITRLKSEFRDGKVIVSFDKEEIAPRGLYFGDDPEGKIDGSYCYYLILLDDLNDADDKEEEKTDKDVFEEKGLDICKTLNADVAYLSFVNPKDHGVHVYQIDTELDFGHAFGDCSMDKDITCNIDMSDESRELTLTDVVSRAFIDTSALYIRTKQTRAFGRAQNGGSSNSETVESYTTWVFAGDNYRPVTHWNDSTYTSSTDQEGGADGRFSSWWNYSESYMYYKAGEFVCESGSEGNFLDILLGRP